MLQLVLGFGLGTGNGYNCVELDKIPLLHKLKLHAYLWIYIAYTANNILYKLYSKMASLFLVYGIVIT